MKLNENNRWEYTFVSPFYRETLFESIPLGEHESTMELFEDGIEWGIPALCDCVWIGLWFEDQTLTDYDGVFELPKQAIELLEHAGYIISQEFKN